MKRDFFLDKKREKAKLEAEMKLQVTLKCIVPAGEAEPVGPLNVICGQYFINTASFCKELNTVNDLWKPGVLCPVVVTKGLRAKEYNVVIKAPTTTFLIDAITHNYRVFYLDLWALIKLKQRIHTVTETAAARLVFSKLFCGIVFDESEIKEEIDDENE